ncbi:MAG TPA: response regulator transcription factor [Acidimicrobiales bacterium]|nr:response regulator transcription factor [Acidimicrobiales bacterium]
MPRVLVVDDDPALVRVLRIALAAKGYDVVAASDGVQGIAEAALQAPDVVVLDLGLPDIDGAEVCRRIREWSEVPIIVLSADGTEDRKVEVLDQGANDYMTKPFGMNELLARLRVALRHAPVPQQTELDAGPLHLDLVHHEARMAGEVVELTKREFAFASFLAQNAGKVCTHRMVLEAVWGPRYLRATRYLREYAYRLRRKLGDEDGRFIVTHPGIGYQLVIPEPPASGGLPASGAPAQPTLPESNESR